MDGGTYTHGLLDTPGVSALFEDFYYQPNDEKRYSSFKVKKRRGGYRTIDRPCTSLLKIQSLLAEEFSKFYEPTPIAHGYVQGRSILSNATPHVGKPFILNLDIQDFFGSIDDRTVERTLHNLPVDITEDCISIISNLVTYKNRLPQGSPTSPVLSNLACRELDNDIARYASNNLLEVTRYGDDITFSPKSRSNERHEDLFVYDRGRIHLSSELGKIFSQHGFEFNNRKTKASFKSLGQRQVVTGLIVNNFPNVFRDYIRKTQSMLYSWEKWGLGNAQKHHQLLYKKKVGTSFVYTLAGRVAYISSIRGSEDRIVRKLVLRLQVLIKKDNVDYPVFSNRRSKNQ